MKKTRIVLSIFFVTLFFYSVTANAFSFRSLSDKVAHLRQSLSRDETHQNNLQKELQTVETSLNKVNREILRINQAIANERFLLKKLQTQQQKTQINLAIQQKLLGKQIKNAYLLGQPNAIKVIFNQENPNTLSRHLNYYHYLMRTHLDLVTSIKNSLASLKNTMQTISTHEKTLQTLLADNQKQQTTLQTLQTERQALVAHLDQKIQKEQLELNQLLAKLSATPMPDLHVAFANLRGKLLWPVNGTIAANFGSTVDATNIRLEGVLIKATEGTPVHAIAAGKIVFANWLRGFGLLTIIDHGSGYMSLYARNQTLLKKPGDTVKPGETIATTGNSGGFATHGLYFEIRQNGLPVNPNSWCG